MRVLVACEESQVVCTAFRNRGHEAYSCDIQEPSGGHPEWHIHGDVLPLLNGNCAFRTRDGAYHNLVGQWDMLIAFPPCTHLAVSGARHFEQKRADGRQLESIKFFASFFAANCEKIAIENPVNIISGKYVTEFFGEIAEKYGLPRKPSQYIQPYEFGNQARKKTCLWLSGLPLLKPTDVVDCGEIIGKGFSVNASLAYARDEKGRILSWNDPRTGKIRSRTFPGIAKAMAEQWG